MTFNQKREELISKIADALISSGRTCDSDNWPDIMAYEAWCVISEYFNEVNSECERYKKALNDIRTGMYDGVNTDEFFDFVEQTVKDALK